MVTTIADISINKRTIVFQKPFFGEFVSAPY